MKTRNYIMLSALAIALIGFTGCSSSGDGESSTGYVAQTPTAADSFEGSSGDNNMSTASSISIGDLQNRTIYPDSDEDWIAVELVAGTVYEFSANNLEESADTEIWLYDENGTTPALANSDDFVDYDSNIYDYTASYTGTHYLQVTGRDYLASYQLGVRVYVDADGDSYSPFYDCNDNNDSIEPWAMDIGGNGIDENCDGIDAIADATADSYEDDDTLATAKAIPTTYGSMEELQNRYDIQSQMRTIHEAGDVDFLKVTVAPYSAGEIIDVGMGSLYYDADQYSWEIQDENGSVLFDGTSNVWESIENTTDTTVTYYLKVFAGDATSTGGYMPAYISYGEDRDGDGYYTKESDNFDPDDNNASIP